MSLQTNNRVKNYFKAEKNAMYARMGGGSQPEGINDVWLQVARKFNITVRQAKDIVYPGGWYE